MGKQVIDEQILSDEESGFKKDKLMLAIQVEIDKIVTKEVCDAIYDSPIPKTENARRFKDKTCLSRKTAIMKVISASVNVERLYFIIRSSIMGAITGVLTYAVISIFAVTNFFTLVLLGILFFVVSLFLSRFLDKPIVDLSYKIIAYLKRHRQIRRLVLNRL
ncbi:MAG: hypothetical protein NWF01_08540 [Candidatus Bathyarchaeota archaeon]|nr:hypothetical protein [Candidatus Bathyarchaeota archaeon]